MAKINGDIVTRGDLEKAANQAEREMRQQGLAGPALQQQTGQSHADELRNQIDRLLLVQKAKELDINVDADLTREIAGIQSESKIADPDKFHDFVRQQTGMSFEDFVQQRKNLLLTDRVVSEEVWRNIVIPDADIQKYYDAHKSGFRAQGIGDAAGDSDFDGGWQTGDRGRRAEEGQHGLLARARSGVDKFSDLARQYSDDASATDDGLLPYPSNAVRARIRVASSTRLLKMSCSVTRRAMSPT